MSILKGYLKRLHEIASRGDAREESFYSALKWLIDRWSKDKGLKGVHVTTLPKKTEAGVYITPQSQWSHT